ncbi:MAG: hypothetical protein K0S55_553 [Clostridia bacterium]|nr:hypothetical protein [Clostridia bacterium]
MKSNTLSRETMAYIKKETEAVIKQFIEQDNTDIKTVLKWIYLSELPEKTEEQAILMADAIIEAAYSFNKEYKTAMEDPDGWVDSFLANRLNGKALDEQYDMSFRLLIVLTLMQAQAADCSFAKDDFTIEEFLNKMEDGRIANESLTEQDVEDIVSKIKELSHSSSVIFNGCDEAAKLFEGQMDVKELYKRTQKANKDAEFRAIAAMIGYVGCKNGNIKDIPADMTAKQITYEICAGMEAAEVVEKVEKGEMAWVVAKTILKVLANIVLLYAAYKFIMLGAAVGGILIGSTFGILIGAGLITWLFFNFSNAYDKFIDTGLEITQKATVFTFDMFKKGLKTISDWMLGTVIPTVAGLVKSVVKYIRDKVSDGLTVVKEAVEAKQKVFE